MNKIGVLLFVLFLLISCKEEKVNAVDVSNIEVAVEIDRFDQKFYNSDSFSLSELKSEYPYLFPAQNHDSIWIQKRNDIDENKLFKKADNIFSDNAKLEQEFESLFKHIKYHFSNFESPKIVTLISNVDYESKVIYADSLMLVSLDMYLGKGDEVYSDFPAYLSNNYKESQLIVDAAIEISTRYYMSKPQRQFINSVISEGKKLFLLDVFLPETSDENKIGYLIEELNWAKANEKEIWKYFVDNKLLFSTEPKLNTRFINNAPFSKFYMDLDKDSPGRIGVWLGWQIVRSYMNNNNVTLHQLLQLDEQELYKNSKYKPKK